MRLRLLGRAVILVIGAAILYRRVRGMPRVTR